MSNNVIPLSTAEARPCAQCGEHAARLSFQDERFPYGGGKDEVILTARVPVWTCDACKTQYTDGDAEDIRHAAICRHLNRLTPSDVRNIREQYGLSQREWSERTGFGLASIKRWETGNLIQNESTDRYMRLLINADIFSKVVLISEQPTSRSDDDHRQ
jgi:putative zinc finger/helix-turn-helix YgiT family protein